MTLGKAKWLRIQKKKLYGPNMKWMMRKTEDDFQNKSNMKRKHSGTNNSWNCICTRYAQTYTHTHKIRVEFKNWFDTNEPEYIINVNYRIPFVYLKGRHFWNWRRTNQLTTIPYLATIKMIEHQIVDGNWPSTLHVFSILMAISALFTWNNCYFL